MRIVFRNHAEVVKKWAEQSQFEGSAGNVGFRTDTVYSYGYWWMARFIKPDIVLVRDETYSVSTTRHQGIVWSAIRGMTTYHVPDSHNHDLNIGDYLWRVRAAADAFWNCRERPALHKNRHSTIVAEMRRYVTEFVPEYVFPPLFGLELSGQKAAKKLERAN